MANYRDAQVILIMGKNGTGKSTYAKKIIDKLGSRALLVSYNGMPKIWRKYKPVDVSNKKQMNSFKGYRQVHFARHDTETFQYIYRNFNKGTIVFDDCRGYIKSNVQAIEWLKRILMDFRHKMLDIIFVVHSPRDIPPNIWSFYSNAFIGATDALVPQSLSINNKEAIIEKQKIVNNLYLAAKNKNDNSHYGIFLRVQA